MTARTQRRLELLDLGARLRGYARRLDDDANAAALMVHKALAAAFREPPADRPSRTLEASLREDIDRDFATADAAPLAC